MKMINLKIKSNKVILFINNNHNVSMLHEAVASEIILQRWQYVKSFTINVT